VIAAQDPATRAPHPDRAEQRGRVHVAGRDQLQIRRYRLLLICLRAPQPEIADARATLSLLTARSAPFPQKPSSIRHGLCLIWAKVFSTSSSQARARPTMSPTTPARSGLTPYLLFLVFVTTLGPLQFGYHLVCPRASP
jgi:hypothetical protein